MSEQTFEIAREITVHAPRELVYRYFTDPERLATWMGEGSRIGGAEGDEVDVAVPGGARARGRVLEATEPELLRFSWGYEGGGNLPGPGESTVEVRLEAVEQGTRVLLRHVLPVGAPGGQEELSWTCHVARLAARAAHGHLDGPAAAALSAWHEAWSSDGEAIREKLSAACVENLVYRDDSIEVAGRERLAGHIARCRAIAPGVDLTPSRPALLLGATLTADQRMTTGDGIEIGRLRLVARLAPDGRIREGLAFFETPIPGVTPGAALSDRASAPSPGAAAAPLEPHFWVTDLEATVRFYVEALGFEVLSSYPGEGKPTWHQLGRGRNRVMVAAAPNREKAKDGQVYLAEAADRTGTPGSLSLYLTVDDADALHAACVEAGAKIVEPIQDPFWGGRQFTVADPDGHWWTVSGPRPEEA